MTAAFANSKESEPASAYPLYPYYPASLNLSMPHVGTAVGQVTDSAPVVFFNVDSRGRC